MKSVLWLVIWEIPFQFQSNSIYHWLIDWIVEASIRPCVNLRIFLYIMYAIYLLLHIFIYLHTCASRKYITLLMGCVLCTYLHISGYTNVTCLFCLHDASVYIYIQILVVILSTHEYIVGILEENTKSKQIICDIVNKSNNIPLSISQIEIFRFDHIF